MSSDQFMWSPSQWRWGAGRTRSVSCVHEINHRISAMTVLALTIFVSTALVCFFLFLFIMTVVSGNTGPQEALFPLREDANAKTPEKGEER